MIAIKPIAISDANMTSNVDEPSAGEVAWVAGNTYALGAVVIRPSIHGKYKNILAGQDNGLPENTPGRWSYAGSTNKYAMFDLYRNSQTVAPSPLIITITPNQRISALSLVGLSNGYLTVVMQNGASEIYRFEKDLNNRVVTGYYDYCYAPFSNIKAIGLIDLPPISTGVITITLTSPTGTVKVGGLAIGTQTYMGALQFGAKLGSLNWSTIERSEIDGSVTLFPRPNKPKLIGQLFAEAKHTEKIEQLKQDLDAVPAVFFGLDDNKTDPRYTSLIISGLLRQLEQSLDYQTSNLLDVEIEEI